MISNDISIQLKKTIQNYQKINIFLCKIAEHPMYQTFTEAVRKLCEDHINYSNQKFSNSQLSKSSKSKRKKLSLLKESLKMVANRISKLYDFLLNSIHLLDSRAREFKKS